MSVSDHKSPTKHIEHQAEPAGAWMTRQREIVGDHQRTAEATAVMEHWRDGAALLQRELDQARVEIVRLRALRVADREAFDMLLRTMQRALDRAGCAEPWEIGVGG